jgi:hypothetical protein
MTVMSSFWRYLFVGIALMVWPRTWPVGSYHCIARYWLHGYAQCLKRKRISVTTYIQVFLPSNVCLQSIYVLKYRLISTLVSEEDKPIVYSWLTLQQSAWPTVAFACCSLSILFPVEIRARCDWCNDRQRTNCIEWVSVCVRECAWHSRDWCLCLSMLR